MQPNGQDIREPPRAVADEAAILELHLRIFIRYVFEVLAKTAKWRSWATWQSCGANGVRVTDASIVG